MWIIYSTTFNILAIIIAIIIFLSDYCSTVEIVNVLHSTFKGSNPHRITNNKNLCTTRTKLDHYLVVHNVLLFLRVQIAIAM